MKMLLVIILLIQPVLVLWGLSYFNHLYFKSDDWTAMPLIITEVVLFVVSMFASAGAADVLGE